mgnify:CR=1 FL=1
MERLSTSAFKLRSSNKPSPMELSGISPMKSNPNKKSEKKSSSDDKYAYNKGSKFVDEEEKGRDSKIGTFTKHSGGFGVITGGTNAKGYTRKENEFLTGGFAEYMKRDGFAESEINNMFERRGVKGPYKK